MAKVTVQFVGVGADNQAHNYEALPSEVRGVYDAVLGKLAEALLDYTIESQDVGEPEWHKASVNEIVDDFALALRQGMIDGQAPLK